MNTLRNKKILEKILEVDLSSQTIKEKIIDDEIQEDFIGGMGIGVKILYDLVGPDIDPLSKDNIVVIATGPLSGTTAPTRGRTHILTKSPITEVIGMGNFGGLWGSRFKASGFEILVIKGKSEFPVYLWISDGNIEIRKAMHLWGKDTWETTDELKESLGDDISVLTIGQAGENLVKFACPVIDYDHAPGRSHAGCILGSKLLKAVVVKGKGKGNVPIANKIKFNKVVNQLINNIENYPDCGERRRVGSHSSYVANFVKSNAMQTGNFATGELDKENDLFRLPNSFEEQTFIKPLSYGNCLMGKYYGCDLRADVKSGPYSGLKLGGVAFSMAGVYWGGQYGINKYPAMFKCRELCQRYGMDQVGPILFAIELLEKGIISKDDLDGVDLRIGNDKAIHEMITNIAFRKGFGNILAEGTQKAAELIGNGAEKYALTIKKHQILCVNVWITPWAQKLGIAVCPRGGDDVNTTHAISDMEGFPAWAHESGWSKDKYFSWLMNYIDMFQNTKDKIFGSPPTIDSISKGRVEGKAALVIWFEKLISVTNSLGLCMFPGSVWFALGPTICSKLYSAYIGNEVSPEKLMISGDRIFNLIKAYNVRQGLRRKDDHFPERYYQEPASLGALKGSVVSKKIMNKLLDEYYQLREWDQKTSIPKKEKLYQLGLQDVADQLLK